MRSCETFGQLHFSRHLDKKFGGPNTVLVQILPAFKRYDANGPPIYCNFKLKMSPFGIMFGTGDEFKVDEEMSNVAAIEVWGCAGSETFQKQKSQKLWLQKEAEKKNKVSHGFQTFSSIGLQVADLTPCRWRQTTGRTTRTSR